VTSAAHLRRKGEKRLPGQGTAAAKRPRVALCHLESLICLPAINELFRDIGDQIGLVILSNRFGGKQGGAVRQFGKGIRRSGWRLTLWLGFDIVSAQVVSRIADVLKICRPKLKSVRALAREHGAQILQVADVNGPECLDAVRSYAPDIVLVMNFDQILQQAIISLPSRGVLNVHPSPLPKFRGPCPVFWALIDRVHEAGVTLHVVDSADIDCGPIVAQAKVPLDAVFSAAEVTSALFVMGVQFVRPAIEQSMNGDGDAHQQDEAAASYCSFPTRFEMARAAKEGVHLCRLKHCIGLALASLGPVDPPSTSQIMN